MGRNLMCGQTSCPAGACSVLEAGPRATKGPQPLLYASSNPPTFCRSDILDTFLSWTLCLGQGGDGGSSQQQCQSSGQQRPAIVGTRRHGVEVKSVGTDNSVRWISTKV